MPHHDHLHSHWNTVAHRWSLLGAPLRPCDQDIRIMQRLALDVAGALAGSKLRAVLLGVTPEIAAMDWPPGTQLLALERSAEMIRSVWPGDVNGVRKAVAANWLEAPCPPDSCELVVNDGGLCNLRFPQEYHRLAEAIARWLADGGKFATRCFIRPGRCESPGDVLDALRNRRIGNFHIFKFRLAMALQPDPAAGVRLADVWRAWAHAGIDIERLAGENGWPIDVIGTIDLYRDNNARYSFPTLDELRDVLGQTFGQITVVTPDYEMGDRCPTLIVQG